MRISRFWLTVIMSFFPVLAFAHPPSDLTLSYDLTTKVLRVAMTHVTNDTNQHYIRKIAVFRNEEKEPLNFHYAKQTTSQGMEVDLTIEVNPGDILEVEAFCSKGGTGKATLAIPVGKPLPPEPGPKL